MHPVNSSIIKTQIESICNSNSNTQERITQIAALLKNNPQIQLTPDQAERLINLANTIENLTDTDRNTVAVFKERTSKEAEALLATGTMRLGGVIGGKQGSAPPNPNGHSFRSITTGDLPRSSTLSSMTQSDSPSPPLSSSPSSTASVTSELSPTPGKRSSLKEKFKSIFGSPKKDPPIVALEKQLKKSKNLNVWMEQYSGLIKTTPEKVSIHVIKDWITAKEKSGSKPFFGLASVPLHVQLAMIKNCARDDIVTIFPEMAENYKKQINNENSETSGKIIASLRQDFGRDLSAIDISYNNKPLAVIDLAHNIRPVKNQIESSQVSIENIKIISSIEYPDFLAAVENTQLLSTEQKTLIKDALDQLSSNVEANPEKVRNSLKNLSQLTSKLRSSIPPESWDGDPKLKEETNHLLHNIKTKLITVERLKSDKTIDQSSSMQDTIKKLQTEITALYDQLEQTLSRKPEAMTFREQLLTGEEVFTQTLDSSGADKNERISKLKIRKEALGASRSAQEKIISNSGVTLPEKTQTGFYHHTKIAEELLKKNEPVRNNKILQAISISSAATGISILRPNISATRSKNSNIIIDIAEQDDSLIVKTNYTLNALDETGRELIIKNEIAFDLNNELCAMSLSY